MGYKIQESIQYTVHGTQQKKVNGGQWPVDSPLVTTVPMVTLFPMLRVL